MLFHRITIDFIINIAPVLSKLILFHLISFNLEKFHNFTSEYNYNCVFINIFVKKYNFIPMPPNSIMKKDAKSISCSINSEYLCYFSVIIDLNNSGLKLAIWILRYCKISSFNWAFSRLCSLLYFFDRRISFSLNLSPSYVKWVPLTKIKC